VKATSGAADGAWLPPIVSCIATQSQGVDEVVSALEAHREWLTTTETGKARSLRRLREAMRNQLRNTLIEHADAEMHDAIEAAVARVAAKEADPYSAAEELVKRFKARGYEAGVEQGSPRRPGDTET
jgi:LAO/AO transport system kinase